MHMKWIKFESNLLLKITVGDLGPARPLPAGVAPPFESKGMLRPASSQPLCFHTTVTGPGNTHRRGCQGSIEPGLETAPKAQFADPVRPRCGAAVSRLQDEKVFGKGRAGLEGENITCCICTIVKCAKTPALKLQSRISKEISLAPFFFLFSLEISYTYVLLFVFFLRSSNHHSSPPPRNPS